MDRRATKLKHLALITTIISALGGLGAGISTIYSTFNKTKSGHNEHTETLKSHEKDIVRNREEIRFLYQRLITQRRRHHKALPKMRKRNIKRWSQLK